MKLKTKYSLVGIILFLSLSLAYAVPFLLTKKSSLSSVQIIQGDPNKEGDLIETVNSLFSYVQGASNEALLAIKKTQRIHKNREGAEGKVEVSVFTKRPFKDESWSIVEEADDVLVTSYPDQVITVNWGCCSERDGSRAYNTFTGQFLLSFTNFCKQGHRPFVIEVPNTQIPERLLGILIGDSTRDFPAREASDHFPQMVPVAQISYASQTQGLIDKVLVSIEHTQPYYYGYVGDIQFKTLKPSTRNEFQNETGRFTLWDQDGVKNEKVALNGLNIEFTYFFEPNVTVTIPIKNDRLDIASATWTPKEIPIKLTPQ